MLRLVVVLCALAAVHPAQGFAKPGGLLDIVKGDKPSWCNLQLPSSKRTAGAPNSCGTGPEITKSDTCACFRVAGMFCKSLSQPVPDCEDKYIAELEKAMAGTDPNADPLNFLTNEEGWLKMKKKYQAMPAMDLADRIKIHIAGGYRARTVDYLLNKIKGGWTPSGSAAASTSNGATQATAAATDRQVEWMENIRLVEWQMAGSVDLFSDYDVNLVGKDAVQTAALFPLLWLEEFGDPSKPWTWTSSELFDTNCYTPHLLPPEATRDGKREQFNADRKRMDPALRAGMQANAWTMSLTKMLLDAKLHVAARYTAEDPDFVEKVRTEFNRYVPTIADLERAAAATGTTDALPIAKELMTRMRVTAEKCVEQQEKTDALQPAENEALKLMQRAMSSAAYGAAAEKITGTDVPALLKRQELELLEARDAAEAYASHGTVYSIVGITQMNLVGFVPEPGREADSDDACLYVDRDDKGQVIDAFKLLVANRKSEPKDKVVAREPIAILGEELLAALWENAAFFADHAGHVKAARHNGAVVTSTDLVDQVQLLKETGKYLGRIGLVYAMLEKMDPSINCLGCVLDRAPTAREHQYQCDAKMGYDWMVELAKPEWDFHRSMGRITGQHATKAGWASAEVSEFGRKLGANSAVLIAAAKDKQYFLEMLLTPVEEEAKEKQANEERVQRGEKPKELTEEEARNRAEGRNKYGLKPLVPSGGDDSQKRRFTSDEGRQTVLRNVFGAKSSLEEDVQKMVKDMSARLLLRFIAARRAAETTPTLTSSQLMPTIPLNCDLKVGIPRAAGPAGSSAAGTSQQSPAATTTTTTTTTTQPAPAGGASSLATVAMDPVTLVDETGGTFKVTGDFKYRLFDDRQAPPAVAPAGGSAGPISSGLRANNRR